MRGGGGGGGGGRGQGGFEKSGHQCCDDIWGLGRVRRDAVGCGWDPTRLGWVGARDRSLIVGRGRDRLYKKKGGGGAGTSKVNLLQKIGS